MPSSHADGARRSSSCKPPDEHAPPPDEVPPSGDDTLALLFMCCHPALTRPSAVALTLRAVGGLTTREIASAYMVPEATMAQRISRAKQRVRERGARFELPTLAEQRERLGAVLHVLYLIFNEGYATSGGDRAARATDLSAEGIRLTRAVHAAAPDEPETAGLLALMLLTDARRAARTGPDGELVPLHEQDRARWNHDAIARGRGARRRRVRARSRRPVSAPSGDRRVARRGAERRGDRLGRRSSRSTASSRGSPATTRWCG